jgi:DNA-binding transcriptional ArsR family regulator
MMNIRSILQVVPPDGEDGDGSAGEVQEARLDQVFAALSDPIRRRILQQLDGQALLVSELAAPFNISLQGVSRHIQVLVRAGLVQQERSGRISRCTLEAGPLMDAAVWLNRYSKYWQGQFDLLAATLAEIDERRTVEPAQPPGATSNQAPSQASSRAPSQAPRQAPSRAPTRAPRQANVPNPAHAPGQRPAPNPPHAASPKRGRSRRK